MDSNHKSKLNARQYQLDLYDVACSQNTIIFLPTGSGKTLISIMVMDHFSSEDPLMKKTVSLKHRKFTVFLAQTVSLVLQQAKYITNNTSLSTFMVVGDMDTETWTQTDWDNHLDDKEVLVMTAQVFLNILRRGFFNISQICLLVFDECHHARKKHPYNRIMQEFYFPLDVESRPRILGLTASPILTSKGNTVSKALVQIQTNLNCRIYSVEDIDRSDFEFRRSHEEIAIFTETGLEFRRRNLLKLYLARTNPPPKELKNMTDSFVYILENLGIKAMIAFVEDCMLLAKRKKIYTVFEDVDEDETTKLYLKDLLEFCKESFEPENPETELLSTKYKCLSQVLQKFMSKKQSGMVFVRRRVDAYCVCYLLRADEHLKDSVIPFSYVGHSSSDLRGLSNLQQMNHVEMFRSGKYNLMVSTSVAEEGLDIRTCDLVVRFDPPQHLSGYLQSRGRARDKNSHFVVLMEESDSIKDDIFKSLRSYEEQMLQSWQDPDDKLDDNEIGERTFTVESTGALLTMQSCVSVLHAYCAALPSDGYCSLVPIFKLKEVDGGFKVDLELPLNAPVH